MTASPLPAGIEFSDLPMLCRRFATSKLRNLEDLNDMRTFGFRGEALASLSLVSHLSVQTRTSASECAWE